MQADRLEDVRQENARVIQVEELETLVAFYKESYPVQYPQSGPQNAENSVRLPGSLHPQRVYPTNPKMSSGFAPGAPGNWFDARMLETGQYYGIWRQGRLASVAGIHVYSPEYKAAVLGNVTTHPDYRGEGLGTAICARLCQELLKRVEYVGLNVKADNQAAIKVYERIGFEKVETYEEVFCTQLE